MVFKSCVMNIVVMSGTL